jgi:hypothetical protein
MEPNFMIRIQAHAIIASSNFAKDAFAIEFKEQVAVMHLLPSEVKEGPYTVLGNICTGHIVVNHAQLPAPWKALNAVRPF